MGGVVRGERSPVVVGYAVGPSAVAAQAASVVVALVVALLAETTWQQIEYLRWPEGVMDGQRRKVVSRPEPFEVVLAGQAGLAWERTDAGGGRREMVMAVRLEVEEVDGLPTWPLGD